MNPREIVKYLKPAKLPFILYSFLLILSILLIQHSFSKLQFEIKKEQLDSFAKSSFIQIEKNQLTLVSWCQRLSYNKNIEVSVLNSQGKILCDSHLTPLHPPNYFNLNKIRFKSPDNFFYKSQYNRSENKDYIQGLKKISDHYILLSSPLRDGHHLKKSQHYVLTVTITGLTLLFLILSFYFISKELAVDYRVFRLISRLKSKGVHPGIPFTKEDDIVDKVRSIEKLFNKTINKLKNISDKHSFEKEKLRKLLDSLNSGIISVNHKQEILFSNKEFEKIHKLKSPGPGKVWEYFREPELLKKIEQTLVKQEDQFIEGFEIHNSANLKTIYNIRLVPLRQDHQKSHGLMMIFNDQTQLNLWKKMRIDFVANISHEIRTPLTALKGYLDLLTEELNDSRFISKMNDNINRLVSLFEDLLNLSLIESDQKLELSDFSPENLTKEVFSIVQTKFNTNKMSLNLTSNTEVVTLDKDLVEQIITNLIENVFKYAPETKELSIAWQKTSFNISLTVEDQGPGIDSEHQLRVFERFYRTEQSRSQKIPGTGLGLSIVKNIVEKHSGNISLESEKGKGCKFKISLPLYKELESIYE